MALDWEKIIIIDDDEVIEGEDETVMIFASGVPGSSATVEVVGTETLEPTEDAYVENLGTNQNAKLKFGIPHGASGVWGGIAGEIDNQADLKAKFDNVYTKAEADALLDEKLDDLADQTKTGGIVEFDAKTDHAIKDLTVGINPVQDLHGYDNPWPAGGGKNLLPLIVDNIKEINQSGTWSGNTYTLNNVTFAVQTNATGAVTGITVNSSAAPSAYVIFYLCRINASQSAYLTAGVAYKLSGCPASGGTSNYRLHITDNVNTTYSDTGTGVEFTPDSSFIESDCITAIRIASGYAPSGLTFYPMIRLSSVSDATFAPYSNICPISGHTSATVTRTGKNLVFDIEPYAMSLQDSSYCKMYNVGTTAFIRCKKGYTYTISGATGRNRQLVAYFDTFPEYNTDISVYPNSTTINGQITNDNSSGFTFVAQYTGIAAIYLANTVLENVNIQCELGSSATAYEAPQIQTVTVDLDGTRYGGSLDVTAGVLTVDRKIADIGDIAWVYNSNANIFSYALSDKKDGSSVIICSAYKYEANKDFNVSDFCVSDCNGNANYAKHVFIKNSYYTDSSTFQTAMSGQKLVYYLASPVSVTLTPAEVASLIGHNVLWCDTGNSTVVLRLTTGDLAYQDDIDYTSSQIKNKPTLGTMASKDDATSDTKAYGRKDGAWYDLDGRYYTESEVDDKLADKADIIHRSAEGGDIVHITDGSPYPVDALKVGIEPVQDLHGYSSPWPAGGGKNLLPVGDKAGSKNHEVTFTPNGDGTYNVSGTAAQTVNWNIWDTAQDIPSFLNGAKLSGGANSDVSVSITFYENDTWKAAQFSNPSEITINVPEGANKYQVGIRFDHQGVSYTGVIKPMIRLASSANADWEPYANICPISGWSNAKIYRTRKNLLPNEITSSVTEKDVTFEPTADGGIYIHGTNSGNVWQTRICANLSLKAGDYVISIGNNLPANALVQIVNRVENKAYVSVLSNETYKSFTVTKEMENDMRVRFATSGTVAFNNTVYPMIRLASESDSTYEPYNGTSVTVNLNGTRYGGTLDVVNGTLTVDRALVTLTSASQLDHYSTSAQYGSYADIATGGLIDLSHANIISSMLKPTTFNLRVSEPNTDRCYIDDSGKVVLRASASANITSAADLASRFSGAQLVYKLATPQTVTLTPAQLSTILGENYIYCDTGSIKELGYRADTEIYNEQHFARKSSEIVETASGGLVHITDAAKLPVEGLKVGVECTQDLHGYDAPWPAGGGKNLLDVSTAIGTQDGKTFALSSNFGITVSGSASASVFRLAKENLSLAQSTSYIANGMSADIKLRFQLYDGTNTLTREIYATNIDASFTTSASEVKANVVIIVSNNATGTVYPMLRLASVTDATFAPYANVCPITGRTSAKVTRAGKNLLLMTDAVMSAQNITTTRRSDGSVTSYSTGATVTQSFDLGFINVTAGSYTLNGLTGGSNTTYRLRIRDDNNINNNAYCANGEDATITVGNDTVLRIQLFVYTGQSINKTFYPMVRFASNTDASYEEPRPQTVTVNLGGTYYGGTLDVLTGTLTVNRASFTFTGIDAENWVTYNNGKRMESSYYGSQIKRNSSSNTLTGAISNAFQEITSGQSWTASKVGFSINDSNNNIAVSQFIDGGMTVENWKTYLQSNPLTIIAYLATPISVSLTPAQMSLLLGENNVWSDTGNTEVTYIADSKMYIDKKFAELQALILEN